MLATPLRSRRLVAHYMVVLRVVLVAFGLFLATNATAGELRGKVSLSKTPRVQRAAINPYPGIAGSSIPSKAQADWGGIDDVVIYLTGPTAVTQFDRTEPVASLYQIDKCFQPRVLGVPVGATVDFPNGDVVFHNVFSYSKTKKFDLGYYGNGKAKRVRFDKPGLVKVFCDIHSSMSAFILVVDSPLVTKADKKGNYSFTNLPDGKYTVNYWHPEQGERTDQVTIGGEVAHSNVRF